MVGGALRFAAHGGAVSDVGWLKSNGFDEAGLVVPNGNNPSPAFIHDAGIAYAVLNPFNDAGDPPNTSGDHYAGYMQSIVNNGWNMVAGEGRGGDNVRVFMNYLTYCNYGGIVSEQQYDMYASPWSHPASGPKGHVDYIETYDNYRNYVWDSCINSCRSAQNNGSMEVGILIGGWNMNGQLGSSGYISRIDQMRNAGINIGTVLFWTGQGTDVVGWIKGVYYEVFTGLKNHYGVRYGIGGSGGGGGGTPAAPTCWDVSMQGNRHVWIGVWNSKGDLNHTDWPIKSNCRITGMCAHINCAGNWIPKSASPVQLEVHAYPGVNKSLTTTAAARGEWIVNSNVMPNADTGELEFNLIADNTGTYSYFVKAPDNFPPASDQIEITWGAAEAPSPGETDTPTETTPTDITLPSVTPVPSASNAGLTVILRDHKKKEGGN